MKKIRTVLLVIVSFLLLTGCSPKSLSTVSSDKFKSVMDNEKIEYQDIKSKYSFATNAYLVEDNGMVITYVEGESSYDIQGIFLDECKNAYSKLNEDYKNKSKAGDNWTYIEASDSDKYFFVGRISKSYIVLSAPKSEMERARKIVNRLGYRP